MAIANIYEISNGIPYRTDLKELVNYVNKFSDTKELLLVEIGTFEGGSTFFFSRYFKHVITIDPYDYLEAEKKFLENLKNFNNISKIRLKSDDAVNLFSDNIIDILYIDGNHNREYITNDIKLWLPKIKQNGFISGHDYYKSEDLTEEERKWAYVGDVFPVVNEVLGNPEFKDEFTNWLFQRKFI